MLVHLAEALGRGTQPRAHCVPHHAARSDNILRAGRAQREPAGRQRASESACGAVASTRRARVASEQRHAPVQRASSMPFSLLPSEKTGPLHEPLTELLHEPHGQLNDL